MMPVLCPQCDDPAAPEAVSAGLCARCGAQLHAMAAIDISQLAGLDELGVDVAGRRAAAAAAPARSVRSVGPPHGAFEPPSGSFAPATPAFVPPPKAFAPPAAAFAPPPGAFGDPDDSDQPLGVERSTRAIRIENQWLQQRVAPAAPAAPPPVPAVVPATRRSVSPVAIALAVIAIIAGVAVIFALA